MSRFFTILCTFTLLAPGTLAYAGDNEALGRQHFATASEHYRRGRFAEAEKAFSAGYELTHRPGFLWNLAECARSMGEMEKAVERYRRYIAETPDGPKASEARSRIDELAPQRTETAPAAAVSASSAPAAAVEVSRARAIPERQEEPAPPPDSRPVWIGVVLGTVGGVAIAGGVALEIAAAMERDSLGEQRCPAGATSCGAALQEANDRNNAFTAGGIAALSLGALATGAMIAYWAWPGATERAPEVAILPWASDSSAGASLSTEW